MANYFEITPSIRKLYKDFKTIFVFKFGPKTKKFTPKWQIPLFEKRVRGGVGGVEGSCGGGIAKGVKRNDGP